MSDPRLTWLPTIYTCEQKNLSTTESLTRLAGDVSTIGDLGQTYYDLRKYGEALAIYNRELALEPQSINFRTAPASIAVDAEADLAPLRAVVNTIEAEGPSSAAVVALDSSFQLALRE